MFSASQVIGVPQGDLASQAHAALQGKNFVEMHVHLVKEMMLVVDTRFVVEMRSQLEGMH